MRVWAHSAYFQFIVALIYFRFWRVWW